MKKILFLLPLFILSNIVGAQLKGLDFKTAIKYSSTAPVVYEELIEITPDTPKGYAILFNTNTVGMKHCVEKAQELIQDNGADFDKPDLMDDVLFASYVNGLTDYENLATSVRVGGSEVKKAWGINGYNIILSLTENSFSIFIGPSKKKL